MQLSFARGQEPGNSCPALPSPAGKPRWALLAGSAAFPKDDWLFVPTPNHGAAPGMEISPQEGVESSCLDAGHDWATEDGFGTARVSRHRPNTSLSRIHSRGPALPREWLFLPFAGAFLAPGVPGAAGCGTLWCLSKGWAG